MKEYQEIYGINGGNNNSSREDSVDSRINKVLNEISNLIANAENLYGSKRIDRFDQKHDLSMIDIEMTDATRTFQ